MVRSWLPLARPRLLPAGWLATAWFVALALVASTPLLAQDAAADGDDDHGPPPDVRDDYGGDDGTDGTDTDGTDGAADDGTDADAGQPDDGEYDPERDHPHGPHTPDYAEAWQTIRGTGWTLFRPQYGTRAIVASTGIMESYRFNTGSTDFALTAEYGGTAGMLGGSVFVHSSARATSDIGGTGGGDFWAGFKLGLNFFDSEGEGVAMALTNAFGFSTGERTGQPQLRLPVTWDYVNHLPVKDFTYDLGFVVAGQITNIVIGLESRIQFPFGFPTEVSYEFGFDIGFHICKCMTLRGGLHASTAFTPFEPYAELTITVSDHALAMIRSTFPVGRGNNPAPVGDWLVTFAFEVVG